MWVQGHRFDIFRRVFPIKMNSKAKCRSKLPFRPAVLPANTVKAVATLPMSILTAARVHEMLQQHANNIAVLFRQQVPGKLNFQNRQSFNEHMSRSAKAHALRARADSRHNSTHIVSCEASHFLSLNDADSSFQCPRS